MSIEIRPLQETDSLAELTLLLHRAYRRLAEMGFRFVATYQTEDVTRERVQGAHCWVAVDEERPAGSQLVGTLTLYAPSGSQSCQWYSRPDVWHFGQFAVDPEQQSNGLGSRLLALAETTAGNSGAAELALDTSEGATHLIAYYSKRGYRQVDLVQWGVTNYRSVVLSKSLSPEA